MLTVAAGLTMSSAPLLFTGPISHGAVDAFERRLAVARDARPTLEIDSEGGEAFAALRLAELVRAARLPVRVRGVCGSACAVYVLPASPAVSFAPGAIASLHHIPSPRYEADLIRAIEQTPGVVAGESRRRIAAVRAEFELLLPRQRAFYRHLGVDGARIERSLLDWRAIREAARRALGREIGGFVPDMSYLRTCFGVRFAEPPRYDEADTLLLGFAGGMPRIFLRGTELWHMGRRIGAITPACR